MYEGTWRRGLVENRRVDAFANEHLLTVRVRDFPSGCHEGARRKRSTAGEDQKTPVGQAAQRRGQTHDPGDHRTDAKTA
jgi:hypothetical protein